MTKIVYMGTANWGKKTSKRVAFSTLDAFVADGLNLVDTATNYPINGIERDLSLALSWLTEWQKCNANTPIKVFVKIGSVDNLGSDRMNLTSENIDIVSNNLIERFGDNLYGIGVHWDNRGENVYGDILETIYSLKNMQKNGFRIGISGIKSPDLYHKTKQIDDEWEIQVKEYRGNTLARESYSRYFPNNPFIAYGLIHFINVASGLNEKNRRNSYFEGLEYFLKNERLQGFLVAPNGLDQAMEVLHFFKNFKEINV